MTESRTALKSRLKLSSLVDDVANGTGNVLFPVGTAIKSIPAGFYTTLFGDVRISYTSRDLNSFFELGPDGEYRTFPQYISGNVSRTVGGVGETIGSALALVPIALIGIGKGTAKTAKALLFTRPYSKQDQGPISYN